MSARRAREAGEDVHAIFYIEQIHMRGWFGIPYSVLKLRVAHVDERNWRRLRRRRFSMRARMCFGE